jgi:hypothetical protein
MEGPQIRRDAVGWPTVEAWALARIEQLRNSLEKVSPDNPTKFAAIQGRIEELRHLLKQGEPEETPPTGPVY